MVLFSEEGAEGMKGYVNVKKVLRYYKNRWFMFNGSKLEVKNNFPDFDLNDYLTSRQSEIFRSAIELGFYNFPKEITLEHLAKKNKTSSSTVCVHLQKIESSLILGIAKKIIGKKCCPVCGFEIKEVGSGFFECVNCRYEDEGER